MVETIQFGKGQSVAVMQLSKLNRHGIIAGATGTGKTITLKVLAEQLSKAGVPIFLSDIKGDLMSLAEAHSGDGLEERLKTTEYADYVPQAFPVEVWDVLSKDGIPLRMTVSQMGPILLSQILGLNDVQESILTTTFDVADKKGLLLIDLMDLRAMLNYVAENAKDLSQYYGNIAKNSIGAILRSLVVLEQQGGSLFFGEPAIDIHDFMQTNASGQGIINILNAKELFQLPTLYSMVLFAILSEIYENLPEEGDLDKPKMVFFFDEAHTLFRDTPKVLVEKVELVVRLIRSKGVGIFFVTQNPTDIPDTISSQLGHRIQHGMRAYTPKEIKTVKTLSESFRQDGHVDMAEVIQQLQVGQAVVSSLDVEGVPTIADTVTIYPPQSKIGTIDPSLLMRTINQSANQEKYAEAVNRESAHEQILAATQQQEEVLIEMAKEGNQPTSSPLPSAREEKSKARTSRRSDSNFDRFTKNMMSSVGRELGRMITRSITGMLKK